MCIFPGSKSALFPIEICLFWTKYLRRMDVVGSCEVHEHCSINEAMSPIENSSVPTVGTMGQQWNWKIIQYFLNITLPIMGREPWSSGYGRRRSFERMWVRILVPDTGWTWHFFILICCKNCIVCLKRPKINKKEAGLAHFLKNIEIEWSTAIACTSKNQTVLLFDGMLS